MLGPSGSGKTTMLRLIAGFELPDRRASIELDGRDVSDDPPFDRDVNTVFQDYALFPHMDVATNVEYGLQGEEGAQGRARGAGWRRRWPACASRTSATRKPNQLSGGQRQRVALARALVNRPKVLLLDEPLGALDLKLREEMQVELKQIQQQVGITFVFVTHDQGEALSMSDRVAVFNHGRIEQVGHAARGLRAPGHGVRGRLRRHGQPAARRRRPRHRAPRAHPLRRARRRRDGRHRHRRRRAATSAPPPATASTLDDGSRPHRRGGQHHRRAPASPSATRCSWPGDATDRQRVGPPLAEAIATD